MGSQQPACSGLMSSGASFVQERNESLSYLKTKKRNSLSKHLHGDDPPQVPPDDSVQLSLSSLSSNSWAPFLAMTSPPAEICLISAPGNLYQVNCPLSGRCVWIDRLTVGARNGMRSMERREMRAWGGKNGQNQQRGGGWVKAFDG